MYKNIYTKIMPIIFKKNDDILIVKPHGKMSKEDLITYSLTFEYYLDNFEMFKGIYDLRDMDDAPIGLLGGLSSFMKKIRPKTKEKISCNIIIVNRSIIKNFLNMLFTVIEPASPYHIIDNIKDIQPLLNDKQNLFIKD